MSDQLGHIKLADGASGVLMNSTLMVMPVIPLAGADKIIKPVEASGLVHQFLVQVPIAASAAA